MKTYGLRDIIGPIMVGPSSSHTAGALRIASTARTLFGEQPERVVLTLYGSFAATGSGHGTDKALVAGILGLETDDPQVAQSFALAEEAGVAVDIVWDASTDVAHPNTVDIRCEGAGRTLEMRGVSIGGGAAVIRRINGIDVDITGEHTSVVVHQHDMRGVLAHIASVLAANDINIANANLHRTAKRGDAYTVMETDSDVSATVRDELLDHPSIINARVVHASAAGDGEEVPVPDDAEAVFARWDYASGEELLALCEREGVTIAQAFRAREEALCAKQGVVPSIDAYLDRVLEVMGQAATEPLDNPQPSVGGLIGGEAAKLRASLEGADGQQRLVDPLAARAAQYALATLETNGRMGVIVATPTAGSAGVLPGVLLALRDERGFTHDELREGIRRPRLPHRPQRQRVGRRGRLPSRGGQRGGHGGCSGRGPGRRHTRSVPRSGRERDDVAAGTRVRSGRRPGRGALPEAQRHGSLGRPRKRPDRAGRRGEPHQLRRGRGRHGRSGLRETALGGIAKAPSACRYCAGC